MHPDTIFKINSHPNYRPISHPLALLVLLIMPLLVWAEPTSTATKLAPQAERFNINEMQQGSLLIKAVDGTGYLQAALVETAVTMEITGMVANVMVRQSFTNQDSSAFWANGVYVFPLPENSAVNKLRMKVGERVIEGLVKERQSARKIYQAARKTGKKATLLEQQRPNLFTSRVANIRPGETVVVEIEYQQTLEYDAGWFSLRFPMTTNVRYVPGSGPVKGYDGGGWSYNTDQVTDASQITPPMTPAGVGPANPVTIHIGLDSGMTLANITSAYHAITTKHLGNHRYQIELTKGSVSADRDFVLRYRPVQGKAPQAALFQQQVDNERYGLLMLVPPHAQWSRKNRGPREVVFVIDTSGSMLGTSINQARSALLSGLKRLQPNDSFNIIQFNSITTQFAPHSRDANRINLNLASQYVRGLNANGGTEMAPALRAAFDAQDPQERLRQIIFITDGSVGNEQQLYQLIGQQLGKSRLFTVGIGSAPNSHFMREAATLGRGTFSYIGNPTEVEQKIGALFDKLQFPVLADISVGADDPTVESWPHPIPDLYLHEPLLVHLKLDQQQQLAITGTVGGQPWSTKLPMTTGRNSLGLDLLWARAKITSLNRSLAHGADPAQVRQAVTNLGLKHHLITAYTSLVAVDTTPTRPAKAKSRDVSVAAKMPAGSTMRAPMARLPQTATPQLLNLILMAIFGLIGLATRQLVKPTPHEVPGENR